LKTLKKIDKTIETYFSLPHLLMNILVESFFSTKLLEEMPHVEKNSLISFMNKILFLELKSIKVFKSSLELKTKLPLMVLILLIKDAKNIMEWESDLLNGELFLKLMNPMDYHLTKLFKKMLGDLLDMPLFAKITELFLLLNLKFYLMELTPLNIAKKLLKELTKLCLLLSLKITFSSKVCSLNPIWSLLDPSIPIDLKFLVKKSLLELPLL